jgi:hypothetical protein
MNDKPLPSRILVCLFLSPLLACFLSCQSPRTPSRDEIITSLNSGDYDQARKAAQSLSDFDKRANESLASMLKSPDVQRRRIFYEIARHLDDQRLHVLLDDVKSEVSNYRDVDDICEFLLFLFDHKKDIFTSFEATLADAWKTLLRVSALEESAKLGDRGGNFETTSSGKAYGIGIYWPEIDFDLVRGTPAPLILMRKYATMHDGVKEYIIEALIKAKDSRTVDFIIGILDGDREVIMDFRRLQPLKVWDDEKIQRYLSSHPELLKLIDSKK